LVARRLHDIGYVRGVLNGDDQDGYIVGADRPKMTLPRGSSDAALLPYHVDRSKLFVLDRISAIEELDEQRIARAIECTRFPVNIPTDEEEIDKEGSLLRAADLKRPARRAALHPQKQRAILRMRGGGAQPTARLRLTSGISWTCIRNFT